MFDKLLDEGICLVFLKVCHVSGSRILIGVVMTPVVGRGGASSS